MIRVLLVDDSLVALAVLKRMLSEAPDIDVVGTAINGEEALKILPLVNPHVICTDLNMPRMDGLEFTRKVMQHSPIPIPILVVSISVQKKLDDYNIFELLEAGAIDVFPKPQGGLHGYDGRLAKEFIRKIRVLSGVTPIRRHSKKESDHSPSIDVSFTQKEGLNVRLVVVGASTGGPQALMTIFSKLPYNFPVPIVCVQHISEGFAMEFVSWLDVHTSLSVSIAKEGAIPKPGNIYFPPERRHLTIDSNGRFVFQHAKPDELNCPSVDVTFQSVAKYYGHACMGILLTGMGSDGAEGLLAIAQAGGITIAQDEKSCTIFGMPKQAVLLGAARSVLPLEEIGPELQRITSPQLSKIKGVIG